MAKSDIEILIDHAANLTGRALSPEQARRLADFTAVFTACRGQSLPAPLNIFTFYAAVPASHRAIDYVDVVHDHWQFDYPQIVARFMAAAARSNPQARIYYITDADTPVSGLPAQATVVRLPMDSRQLMYERAFAMAAYVLSEAFDADTAFLDSDAFPNGNLAQIFAPGFDIGITVRESKGFYMPVNEGAIYAASTRIDRVRRFFVDYIATYDHLTRDPTVVAYYGDIKRWRGGQLALNALAVAREAVDKPAVRPENDAHIHCFPCDEANFCVDPLESGGVAAWAHKCVLHFKGDSKSRINEFLDYTEAMNA